MKTRILCWAIVALLLALMVSLFFNYKQYRDAQEPPAVTSIDTSVEWRTMTAEAPQPAVEREVGTITATVPAPRPAAVPPSVKVQLPKDTTGTCEPPDSVTVELPLQQKVYIDSTYTAYVSGYQPRLDSLKFHYPLVTTTITETRKKSDYRRISVGIVGGYGYGFTSRRVEPFIGLGVSVNLW